MMPDEIALEELPHRPRRRLLAPAPLALLGVLLIACGFIAGVLVEKGQTSSSSSATPASAGLASRFAALRGASGAGTSGASASNASAGGASAGGASAAGGFGRSGGGEAGAGATVGQVAYVAGSTLYVTDAEGNTVKVTPAPGASVTKTVNTDVRGIHPGETVLITGTTNAKGAVSAESIRVGAGAGGGGLGALFGGGGGGGGGAVPNTGGTTPTTSRGAEPALFGKGG